MSCNDTTCLVARAIPLPECTRDSSKIKKETLESITKQLDEIVLEREKGAAKSIGEQTNNTNEKGQKIRGSGGAISPADFVTMQSLRSSALARKMNTTSKLTRDCKNLFSDLMQDHSTINVGGDKEAEANSSAKSQNKTSENCNIKTCKSKTKSVQAFVEEAEKVKKLREHSKKAAPKQQEAKRTDDQEEEEKQLISRGPIRISSRDMYPSYHPYGNANEHGIAPQQMINDPSNYNPNVYNYTYECGVGEYYWPNSCETISNSSTPDTVLTDALNGHDICSNSGNELPDSLSDFILKYSRRYTPSPDGSKSGGEIDSASVWTDSPNSITSLGSSDECNSPLSAVSAPNSSPTAPRGGQTAYHRGGDYANGKFGLPKQGSVDSGIGGGLSMQRSRPAKERLRGLIQNNEMDEAWAWTCKCIQCHPSALSYQDADKDTILHIVANHMDMAKIYALVEQMVKIEFRPNETPMFDVQNDKGQTPLFIAIEKRCNEVVDYLLEAGASPNTHKISGDKDAPLHYAATRGLTKIVQIICAYPQTNINSMNGSGFTPLHCAFNYHGVLDEETELVVSNIGVIQLLLKYGADSTIADAKNGKTIFHIAVERMQPELIEILRACLNENALVSAVNKLDLNGKSPINYLQCFGNRISPDMQTRLRQALISCGANKQ